VRLQGFCFVALLFLSSTRTVTFICIALPILVHINSINVETFIISGMKFPPPPTPLLVPDGVQNCQPSCQDCAQLRISFSFVIVKVLLQRWNQMITFCHLGTVLLLARSLWAVSFEIWA